MAIENNNYSVRYLNQIQQTDPFNTDSYWEKLFPPTALSSRENFLNGVSKALKILGIALIGSSAIAAATATFYLSAVPLVSIGAVSLIASKLIFVKDNPIDKQAIEMAKTQLHHFPFLSLIRGEHLAHQKDIIDCFLKNSSFSEILHHVHDVFLQGQKNITNENVQLIKAKLKELALIDGNLTKETLHSLWELKAFSEDEMDIIFEDLLKKNSIQQLSTKIPYHQGRFTNYFPNFKKLVIAKLTANYSLQECKAALNYGLDVYDIANILETKSFLKFVEFMASDIPQFTKDWVLKYINREKLKEQFVNIIKNQESNPSLFAYIKQKFAIEGKLDHLIFWGVASRDFVNVVIKLNETNTTLTALSKTLNEEFLNSKPKGKKNTYKSEMADLKKEIQMSPICTLNKEHSSLLAKQNKLNDCKKLIPKNSLPIDTLRKERLIGHIQYIITNCQTEIKKVNMAICELSTALNALKTNSSLPQNLPNVLNALLKIVDAEIKKNTDEAAENLPEYNRLNTELESYNILMTNHVIHNKLYADMSMEFQQSLSTFQIEIKKMLGYLAV